MIPLARPEPSLPTRSHKPDDPQKAAWLPSSLWRGAGRKTSNEAEDIARGIRNEGGSNLDVLDETAKDAGPGESGLQFNPAGQLGFELATPDMRLSPMALNMLKSSIGGWGGDTGMMDLDKLLLADSLYERVPGLRKVRTSLEQPFDDAIGYEGGGGFTPPGVGAGKGTPQGVLEAYGTPGVAPDDRTNPMSIERVLPHEVEHAIQSQFNLPRGGSQSDPALQKFFRETMQPNIRSVRMGAERARDKFVSDYVQSQGGNPEAMEQALAQWRLHAPQGALLLDQATHMTQPQFGPLGMYKSMAGEQDATRAADRLDMTQEQRVEEPFFQSGGTDKLSPAFQMLRVGQGAFFMPDMRRQLADTMTGRGR